MHRTPPDIKCGINPNDKLWNGYELIETLASLGIAAHQTAVQDRLNALAASMYCIQVMDISTSDVRVNAVAPADKYLTTIRLIVFNDMPSYPL